MIVTIKTAPQNKGRRRPNWKRTQREARRTKKKKRAHRPTPTPSGDPVIERGPTTPRIASIRPEVYLRKLDELLKRAHVRGIGPGDDRRFDRLLRKARAAIDQGSGQEDALQMLAARIGGVRVNRAFLKRKLARLRAAISRARRAAQSAKVSRLEAAEKDALFWRDQNDLKGASRVISHALLGAK